MQIQRISSDSKGRICASQVIQSMSSCVKELIENALDASASSISVRVRSLGDEIEVADNGIGITESNWSKVCQPHSTSKIHTYEDVFSNTLKSHGFRGEALSSLCSLAKRVRILTRTAQMDCGRVLIYDSHGNLAEHDEQVSKAVGTTITVYGLFQDSLPVRYIEMRNTMKKELKVLHQIMTELSLCHCNVQFELLIDGKCSLTSTGGDTAYRVYEKLVGGDPLIEFNSIDENVYTRIFGWVSIPGTIGASLQKQGTQFFFVNKRPQRPPKNLAKEIARLLKCENFQSSKISFVIFVELDNHESFDANVSVDKRDVLFSTEAEQTIMLLLSKGITNLLDSLNNQPTRVEPIKIEFRSSSLKRSEPEPIPEKAMTWTPPPSKLIRRVFINSEPHSLVSSSELVIKNDSDAALKYVNKMDSPPEKRPVAVVSGNPSIITVDEVIDRQQAQVGDRLIEQHEESIPRELPFAFGKEMFRGMEVVGQFNNGFIVTRLNPQSPQLFLVDQHAANEKFLFEQYYRNMTINVQTLLAPKRLKISPVMEQAITENEEAFAFNGFRISVDETDVPGSRILLHSLPTLSGIGFNRSAALTTDDLMEIARGLMSMESEPSARDYSLLQILKTVRVMFASKACRTAVMVGDTLSTPRMLEIVQALATLDSPWNCPHGRPTFKHLLSVDELARVGS